MYRSRPLRSTLNTGYITGVDMCNVCTEAVHSTALTPTQRCVCVCVQMSPQKHVVCTDESNLCAQMRLMTCVYRWVKSVCADESPTVDLCWCTMFCFDLCWLVGIYDDLCWLEFYFCWFVLMHDDLCLINCIDLCWICEDFGCLKPWPLFLLQVPWLPGLSWPISPGEVSAKEGPLHGCCRGQCFNDPRWAEANFPVWWVSPLVVSCII